jgi:hypothetical protein
MKYCLTNISVRCTSELGGGMKYYKYFGALHLVLYRLIFIARNISVRCTF